LFQTGDVLYGEGKLRDLGMVFKPSFKCLKNKKINLSPAFLKLETLLFQNMFLLFHLILYSQSDFDLKKKKSGLREKKTCHLLFLFIFFFLIFILNIYHYLNTFHHTIRQTCLTCLHLSVLCIYNLHNNSNTLVPYNR